MKKAMTCEADLLEHGKEEWIKKRKGSKSDLLPFAKFLRHYLSKPNYFFFLATFFLATFFFVAFFFAAFFAFFAIAFEILS